MRVIATPCAYARDAYYVRKARFDAAVYADARLREIMRCFDMREFYAVPDDLRLPILHH